MLTMRKGMGMAVSAGLLLSLAACANPTASGETEGAQGPTDSPSADVTELSVNDEVAAMVPEEIRDRGTFTVSINPDIAPIKYVDDEGNLAGLVPELLTHAGEVMDVEVTLEKGTFDGMIPGIEAGRFDVIGSINDFEERQGTIDFIDYLQTGTAILVSADSEYDELTPGDLCGLKVGYGRGNVQQGLIEAASDECVENGDEPIQGNGYTDGGAPLLAIKSSQDDAYWGDAQSLLYNAKESPETYKVVYNDIAGPYGIGVSKDNSELTDALRAALLDVVEQGVYDELLEKWGQEEYALPELPLNDGPPMEE